jgi:hypothetical protein
MESARPRRSGKAVKRDIVAWAQMGHRADYSMVC